MKINYAKKIQVDKIGALDKYVPKNATGICKLQNTGMIRSHIYFLNNMQKVDRKIDMWSLEKPTGEIS